MAKLYAELISDKMGRKSTKTGDEIINTYLYKKNIHTHTIKYEGDTVTVFSINPDTKRGQKAQIITS